MNKKKAFLLSVFCILIAGCATWSKTTENYVNSAEKYSVNLPWGWMMHKGGGLLLTRDGIWLENIVVSRRKIDKELPYTKKKFVKGMLPEEIAQIIWDDLQANNKIGNLELIENKPIEISGMDGFRLIYSFTTEDGLKKKCIHYGFGYEDWVYEISFTAAEWHYFSKELDAFNETVDSFKFLGYAR